MDADREQVRAWVETMDAQGYTSDEIRAQLAQAGWTKEEIEELMGAPAAPAPAPQPPVAPPVTTSSVPPPVTQPPPVVETPPAQPPLPQPAVALPPTPGQATAPAYTPGPMAPQPSGTATAALVLGLVSLLFGPLTAIIGVILGIVAMKRGDPGRGMALGGLIISAVVLFGYLVLAGLLLLGFSLAGSAASNSLDGAPKVEDAANSVSDEASTEGEIAADEVRPDRGGPLVPGAGGQGEAKTMCLSRVKALGLAMRMYVSDFDGYLPDATGWPAALAPYTQDTQALRCPADSRTVVQKRGQWETSYTMYEPMGGTMISTLPEPGKAYVLFDGTEMAGEESAADFRHDGGLVLGYADGHAKWVSEAQFKQPD